jgi:NAD(P)-dependent dehydrogenase (short-subunit alcohol dehydrogenase family)/acyl carrier protein
VGAEVLMVTADVADLEEMQAAVTRAQERFGPINGVIHSAGVLGDGAIQQKTQGEVDQVLRPKVLGTVILDTIFKDTPLDFFVLFSSLSALKPGFGQVAYSAANNFLDAFVRSDAARKHRFVTCISWDVWQGEGMAYDAAGPLALQRLKEADFKRRGILPEEGIDVFRRVLGSTYRHIMVSTSDYLQSDDRDLSRLYLERVKKADPSVAGHARPVLSSAYAPPANKTEERLARIWQELLGITAIGVDDNFLELGGDSLIGTQLITRLKATFGVRLPIRSVYLHPTIRTMSTAVEEALISQSSSEKLDEALRKVEGLE